MNYHQAVSYLNSLTNFELKLQHVDQHDFSLDNFQQFLSVIDSPHEKLKCVHIAGSKGKGSTAAMVASILKYADYRVGLYTSPHLYDVRERIRIVSSDGARGTDGIFPGCIRPEDFAAFVSELKDVLEKNAEITLTYFEFLTALAFLYFFRQQVDIVVLETGLGGRLDATNVVKSLVCGLTLIDLEHTKILGDTIEQIAGEKAGIIKPGCQAVISSTQPGEAKAVIQRVSDQQGVNVVFVDPLDEPSMALKGDFQHENAAVAIEIANQLRRVGFTIDQAHMDEGLKAVVWPVRMEMVGHDPKILIDAAHTPASCQWLAAAVAKNFPGSKMILILGVSSDKDKEAIARSFLKKARKVVLTTSSHDRADKMIAETLTPMFQEAGIESIYVRDVEGAINEAKKDVGSDDVIVVAGSLYLAAEARTYFISTKSEIRKSKQV